MSIENDDDSLTTINENDFPSDVLAKLRRLKIQESILTASLNKPCFALTDNNLDSTEHADWKDYSGKIRNSIIDIKNMFEDIKFLTNDAHDDLKDIDINEVKKDVLELDLKIKSLEDIISSELVSLKKEEEEIMRQMDEEPKTNPNNNGKVKIQSKQYNEVVPSPVRVMINSPLKCAEVQRFQEFLSKRKNRYGGWNEYNHNSFVVIWNKFYDTNEIDILEKNMEEINRDYLLPQFLDNVLKNIPGIKLNEILSHSKWYSEFCYLKMCQQKALDKWKDNKRKNKKRQKVKQNSNSAKNFDRERLYRKQNNSNKFENRRYCCNSKDQEVLSSHSSPDIYNAALENLSSDEELHKAVLEAASTSYSKNLSLKLKSSTLTKPTKQWINRCQGAQETSRHIVNDVETIDKLCIPNWRMSLK